MTIHGHTSRRIDPDTLKVDLEAHPGWENGTGHAFSVGEEVLCAEGLGRVARVLGRTQNGSRLLELKLMDGRRDSYFAAASNVLVPTESAIAVR